MQAATEPVRGRRRLVAAAVALSVLAAACGADGGGALGAPAAGGTQEDTPAPAGDAVPTESDDAGPSSGYGEAADPSEADRVIEVRVGNHFSFEPADHEVAVGEVVTFRIVNEGDIEHEFVIGDLAEQEAMAASMSSGDDHAHSGAESNAVTVHGGETGEVTWRFTDAGTVLVGCHVPGHWEGGMRGTITVG